jgi:hypothetical protein
MKRFKNELFFGTLLITLSVLFYALHYLIFRDAHHIFIYLVGDIAFVFFEVLMVTLIIHRVLDERDKKQRLIKLNMVIGAYFSEIGTSLLATISRYDTTRDRLANKLLVNNKWSGQFFQDAIKWLREYHFPIDQKGVDWVELKTMVVANREFLLRLFENPNLLEHESFSELLQATFHLIEELEARDNLSDLPQTDIDHLLGDMKRVYGQLTISWVYYLQHLKKEYPYLFSLAVRQNPFDKDASVVVR